jgi:hypothetical protein
LIDFSRKIGNLQYVIRRALISAGMLASERHTHIVDLRAQAF